MKFGIQKRLKLTWFWTILCVIDGGWGCGVGLGKVSGPRDGGRWRKGMLGQGWDTVWSKISASKPIHDE